MKRNLARSFLLAACSSFLSPGTNGFTASSFRVKPHSWKAKENDLVEQMASASIALLASQYPPNMRRSLATLSSSSSPSNSETPKGEKNGLVTYYRARLRDITGFSLTAVRTILRTMTGISLTAIYTSALTLSGAWIRRIMTIFLSFWPTWLRYFVQPLLVLYYAPLLVIRNLTGPNRRKARLSHEHFVEGWKKAVEVADGSTQYWPVHLNSQNELELDMQELDMKDAIAESSFLSMEVQEKAQLTDHNDSS